jgi:hypothetical protein
VTRLADAPPAVDAVIGLDPDRFGEIMRASEPLSRRGTLIVPATPDMVVDSQLRQCDAMAAAWQTTQDANYIARCALKGHYLEFGTWYGRSFFANYYRYRYWLDGLFFAFDSFAGLSRPLALETTFTAGDFYEGGYSCNARSFEAIADLVDMPRERMRIVPGFFDDTLRADPSAYGLAPGTVSVCAIDCDLREPTEAVLRFVTPLLEPGALLYFDDWRLTRASAHVGERAAALGWMREHPEIELIEFARDHWQHQWFIYQRR